VSCFSTALAPPTPAWSYNNCNGIEGADREFIIPTGALKG